MNTQKIVDESQKNVMDKQLSEMFLSEQEETKKVFRTAYFISKNQRLHCNMSQLVDCN